MTERDKHIEMAQRLGLVGMRPHLDGIYIDALAAFAKLVADDARATPALPEGMAIVPVEPTDEMVDYAERMDWSIPDSRAVVINIWQAMLAAAKEPATCSVCGLKRSDTKNCKAPDCSPMLAAKENGNA